MNIDISDLPTFST